MEQERFYPCSGDLYARPGNDGSFALVILPEREMDNGYLCYALLLSSDGKISAPQMVVIVPTDKHLCINFPFSYMAQLAYTRALQIRGRLN